MKLILPLSLVALAVSGCSSAPRQLWATGDPYGYSSPSPDGGTKVLWTSPRVQQRWADDNATRRSLYSPNQASGPYTTALADGSWRYGGRTVDQELHEARQERRFQEMLNQTPRPPAPEAAAPAL